MLFLPGDKADPAEYAGDTRHRNTMLTITVDVEKFVDAGGTIYIVARRADNKQPSVFGINAIVMMAFISRISGVASPYVLYYRRPDYAKSESYIGDIPAGDTNSPNNSTCFKRNPI